jgi:hypothetical protein
LPLSEWTSHILDQFLNCANSLLIVAMFEQLLYNIVAIWMSGPQAVMAKPALSLRVFSPCLFDLFIMLSAFLQEEGQAQRRLDT